MKFVFKQKLFSCTSEKTNLTIANNKLLLRRGKTLSSIKVNENSDSVAQANRKLTLAKPKRGSYVNPKSRKSAMFAFS